jgi:ATP-dependent Clp protease ATP-binding subunit ClpA
MLQDQDSDLSRLIKHYGLDISRIQADVTAELERLPRGATTITNFSEHIDHVIELNQCVVGQRHGLDQIERRVEISRAQLDDPSKPVGVFMLVSPSGVGKTETALALAEMLHGGEHNVVTINMSEFQEARTVSTLKGAPPGYVGYGEGGVPTEAVRRKPYSASCNSTRSKKPTRISMKSSSRCSTRAGWKTARVAASTCPRIGREYLERALAGTPLTAVHVTSSGTDLELSFQ